MCGRKKAVAIVTTSAVVAKRAKSPRTSRSPRTTSPNTAMVRLRGDPTPSGSANLLDISGEAGELAPAVQQQEREADPKPQHDRPGIGAAGEGSEFHWSTKMSDSSAIHADARIGHVHLQPSDE